LTNFKITEQNVAALVAAGRARWKIEKRRTTTPSRPRAIISNTISATVKEHLFLRLLAAMNILAFLYHSFLSFTNDHYRLIRAALATRKTFFDDLRALTRYLLFRKLGRVDGLHAAGAGDRSLRQAALNHRPA